MTNTYDILLNPPPSKQAKSEKIKADTSLQANQQVSKRDASVPPVKVQSSKKVSRIATTRNHDVMVSSNHTTTQPRHHDTMTSSMVETVRKAVRQVGKEAATHRFTEEEKRAIADIIYTYGRQGYKTSENEITRIAVNWLVLDYQDRGKQSVLSRLLDTLHE